MKKASRKISSAKRPQARARRASNPYVAWLADRPWRVTLDPDLVDLLTAVGEPGNRLLSLAHRPKRRGRTVVVIPMTDREYTAIRSLLERIGAHVEESSPHPNVLKTPRAATTRSRKAGSPRS
jgi:hypothetical protein